MENLAMLIMAFLFVSCNNGSKETNTEPKPVDTKSIEINLMPNSALDNNLLRSLDGTINVQNSAAILAYPWHDTWGALYEELGMAKNSGLPTPEQRVSAYQIKNAEKMKDIFYSLPMDNEWKWMTQSQVVEFCLSNRNFIKNSKNDIVFFCKRDENKPLYERNLTGELVAIMVIPELGGETRMRLGIMRHDMIGGCVVIVPQNEIGVVKY